MLKATIDLTVEDLRILHQAYFQAHLFARYYDRITIDDERGRRSFLPMSEEEVARMNLIRHRAFDAMDRTYSALPADHPDVQANEDVAELWTPYPDEVPAIQALLNTWDG